MQASLSSLLGLKAAPICLVTSTLLLLCLFRIATAFNPATVQVIYAVNAGGPEHIDKQGIKYQSDPLNVGIASDYGNNLLMVGRVPQKDEPLYRTERYHTATFGYEFKHGGDGNYALILKFCEVYFHDPRQKIFDVVLNGRHTIVSQLDIFEEAGHGSAHQEVAYFTINNGRLQYNGEVSDVRNGLLRLDFIKGKFDNPKINAFVLLKGDDLKIPPLPPLPEETIDSGVTNQWDTPPPQLQQQRSSTKPPADTRKKLPPHLDVEDDIHLDDYEEEEEENGDEDVDRRRDFSKYDNEEEDDEDRRNQKNLPPQKQNNKRKGSRKTSGPRQTDPYNVDDSSMLLPILVAVGAFIPLLFCLCKL